MFSTRASTSMLSMARAMTLNTSRQSRRYLSNLPRERRSLPKEAPRRTPLLVGAGIVGVSLWIGGLSYAMNYQRQSSSVVHGTLFTVRYDPRVRALLGENVGYADSWAWIDGSVNHLKGQVNIKFNIKGDNGQTAKVHFASRRDGNQWQTLVFNVVREDGVVINLDQRELTDTGAPVMALSS
ncbi:hypothetical protein K450DRAFT_261973 [Umbelopsis ramanniana AG]|uniref:DUF1783-domain-containing protein n=1 Tax=Umbelopsis ramanniana AG TaxID=1314678 RepID=A0AAD5E2C0_UMBRA|nr:uncharacterized protein K450DRAFT_261973 [Umbelopsis ramanniana AG]KAI8575427.1 hypothetical protein K450DRAFT_261973 [Umbelopsis ramanniana AG]